MVESESVYNCSTVHLSHC